jgi:hypothetical protein
MFFFGGIFWTLNCHFYFILFFYIFNFGFGGILLVVLCVRSFEVAEWCSGFACDRGNVEFGAAIGVEEGV